MRVTVTTSELQWSQCVQYGDRPGSIFSSIEPTFEALLAIVLVSNGGGSGNDASVFCDDLFIWHPACNGLFMDRRKV